MFWIFLVLYLCSLSCVKSQNPEFRIDDGVNVPLSENVVIGDEIPGIAEIDYPIHAKVPRTSFSCDSVVFPGYYADVESRCQAFYICQRGGKGFGFLCPNGTLFNQEVLVCDWWNNVNCERAPQYYSENQRIFTEMNVANERLGIPTIPTPTGSGGDDGSPTGNANFGLPNSQYPSGLGPNQPGSGPGSGNTPNRFGDQGSGYPNRPPFGGQGGGYPNRPLFGGQDGSSPNRPPYGLQGTRPDDDNDNQSQYPQTGAPSRIPPYGSQPGSYDGSYPRPTPDQNINFPGRRPGSSTRPPSYDGPGSGRPSNQPQFGRPTTTPSRNEFPPYGDPDQQKPGGSPYDQYPRPGQSGYPQSFGDPNQQKPGSSPYDQYPRPGQNGYPQPQNYGPPSRFTKPPLASRGPFNQFYRPTSPFSNQYPRPTTPNYGTPDDDTGSGYQYNKPDTRFDDFNGYQYNKPNRAYLPASN